MRRIRSTSARPYECTFPFVELVLCAIIRNTQFQIKSKVAGFQPVGRTFPQNAARNKVSTQSKVHTTEERNQKRNGLSVDYHQKGKCMRSKKDRGTMSEVKAWSVFNSSIDHRPSYLIQLFRVDPDIRLAGRFLFVVLLYPRLKTFARRRILARERQRRYIAVPNVQPRRSILWHDPRQ